MHRPSGSLISYFSNRVKKEGGINLAQGTPGFPPPAPLLQTLKDVSQDPKHHQYAPGIGNYRLLETIRQSLSPISPIEIDNLLIVQGATEGIFLTFFYLTTQLERPYSVLSFDPVYESYPKLARMFGIPFIYGQLEPDLSVDFQRLEETVRQENVKVIFIASPGNPLGKVWSKDEMEQIVELSRRYGIYILFDAVYKDIYFEQAPYNPLALNYDKLFYIDSFSKTLSITGWRIGYIVTPAQHMERIRSMHDYTGLSAPSILQVAIVRYLQEFDLGKEYIRQIKEKCRQSYRYIHNIFNTLGFKTVPIEGGYFIWTKCPEPITDAYRFAKQLYEKEGVAVVPGENFSPTKTAYIRVNIAAELDLIKEAAQKLTRFFRTGK